MNYQKQWTTEKFGKNVSNNAEQARHDDDDVNIVKSLQWYNIEDGNGMYTRVIYG